MTMKWKYYAEITKKKKTRVQVILNSHRNISLIKQQFVLTHGHAILQDREKKTGLTFSAPTNKQVFFTTF